MTTTKRTTKKAAKLPPPADPATVGGSGNLDLRADGSIVVDNGHHRWTLRPPLLGEYRDIKAAHTRAVKALLDETTAAAAEGAELAAQLQGASKVEQVRALSDRLAAVRLDDIDPLEHMGPFWSLTFSLLADGPHELDDLPVWLVLNKDAAAKMLDHWRTVPLGRG